MRSYNDDFIEKCKSIDFSAESTNRERNLEALKTKISDIDKERNINMNKIPLKIALVAAVVLSLSMVVYGNDLVRIIKTVTLGNRAEFIVAESVESMERVPIEEEFAGKIFDKDGNALTHYPMDRQIYNADGEPVFITFDGETTRLMTKEEYDEFFNVETVEFYDIEEGKSHFVTDVLMSEYMPEGYSFDKISFFGDLETLKTDPHANMYMSVFYSNGKDEIYSQVRFMDETYDFVRGASKDAKEMKLNGHDALLDGNRLYIQIGDVMYMFFANENLDPKELVKMAETLK